MLNLEKLKLLERGVWGCAAVGPPQPPHRRLELIDDKISQFIIFKRFIEVYIYFF
jgi:hypothetical protein